jgi:hypothetical protein
VDELESKIKYFEANYCEKGEVEHHKSQTDHLETHIQSLNTHIQRIQSESKIESKEHDTSIF